MTLTFAGQPYSEIAQNGELEFRMLAVDPAYQGSGMGRAVVREVVEHARQLPGIGVISITGASFMESAHNLYGRSSSAARRNGTDTSPARTCS